MVRYSSNGAQRKVSLTALAPILSKHKARLYFRMRGFGDSPLSSVSLFSFPVNFLSGVGLVVSVLVLGFWGFLFCLRHHQRSACSSQANRGGCDKSILVFVCSNSRNETWSGIGACFDFACAA